MDGGAYIWLACIIYPTLCLKPCNKHALCLASYCLEQLIMPTDLSTPPHRCACECILVPKRLHLTHLSVTIEGEIKSHICTKMSALWLIMVNIHRSC